MSYEAERAIAKAATPGPYKLHPYSDTTVVAATIQDSLRHRAISGYATIESKDRDEIAERNRANARYGATFNPEVVLGLLDKLERYEKALKNIAGGGYQGDRACYRANAALNPTEANDG